MQMYHFNQNSVDECIRNAVPHIADHLINKACANNGFNDNPMAIHPVTKLLTLNLDKATRFSIESELIDQSNLNEQIAMGQITFIKSCFSVLTYDLVIESVGSSVSKQIWEALNDDCGRDGCLFLEMISKWDKDLQSHADRLVETWSL